MWQVPVPGTTRAVNINGDGRLAIAAFGDGTLRWYRMTDGTELLALFLHADGTRWVLWTPEGFFDASSGGETLIGYHLNQGPEAAGKFVQVKQLYTLFYRPELVAQRLDEGIAPALREALAKIGDVRDEALRTTLEKYLSLLRRQGLLQEWHDRNISAGSDWKHQIDQHLEAAQLILLLISPDFLHSDYCHDNENS